MTKDALARANEIEKEKEQIRDFVNQVTDSIVSPANRCLSDKLRKKMSVDGLGANLDALIKVWQDQTIATLDKEFDAL